MTTDINKEQDKGPITVNYLGSEWKVGLRGKPYRRSHSGEWVSSSLTEDFEYDVTSLIKEKGKVSPFGW